MRLEMLKRGLWLLLIVPAVLGVRAIEPARLRNSCSGSVQMASDGEERPLEADADATRAADAMMKLATATAATADTAATAAAATVAAATAAVAASPAPVGKKRGRPATRCASCMVKKRKCDGIRCTALAASTCEWTECEAGWRFFCGSSGRIDTEILSGSVTSLEYSLAGKSSPAASNQDTPWFSSSLGRQVK